MVGIVIVSHSESLAHGVVDFISQMAQDVPIIAAGGMEDGSLGTSYEKIYEAIDTLHQEVEDILLFADIGSSIMTLDMVLEDLDDDHIQFVDAPLVEGAFVAAIQANMNAPFQKIIQEAQNTWNTRKQVD